MSWSLRTHKFLARCVVAVITFIAFWVTTIIISVIWMSGASVLINPAELEATAKRAFWLSATFGKTAGDQKRFEDFLGHWRLHNGAIPEGAPYAENPTYLRDMPMRTKIKSPFEN